MTICCGLRLHGWQTQLGVARHYEFMALARREQWSVRRCVQCEHGACGARGGGGCPVPWWKPRAEAWWPLGFVRYDSWRMTETCTRGLNIVHGAVQVSGWTASQPRNAMLGSARACKSATHAEVCGTSVIWNALLGSTRCARQRS